MQQQQIDTFFSKIEKIHQLTPIDRQRLLDMVEERTFHRRATIVGINSLTTYAFYVVEGSLRLFYTDKGRDCTAGFTMAGEFVIIPRWLLANYPDTMAIEFLENSTLLFLPNFPLKDLLKQRVLIKGNEAQMFIIVAMMEYIALLEEHLQMMHMTSEEKVQWLEDRWPKLFECANMTQIASYLGMAKETLYRIRGGKYRRSVQQESDNITQ